MNDTQPTHEAAEKNIMAGDNTKSGPGWLPNRSRHMLISFLGEFVGTFLFLFFAFAGTQVANNLLGTRSMDISTLLYIALAFGVSLAVNVWIFFRISGGQFNPAVSIDPSQYFKHC